MSEVIARTNEMEFFIKFSSQSGISFTSWGDLATFVFYFFSILLILGSSIINFILVDLPKKYGIDKKELYIDTLFINISEISFSLVFIGFSWIIYQIKDDLIIFLMNLIIPFIILPLPMIKYTTNIPVASIIGSNWFINLISMLIFLAGIFTINKYSIYFTYIYFVIGIVLVIIAFYDVFFKKKSKFNLTNIVLCVSDNRFWLISILQYIKILNLNYVFILIEKFDYNLSKFSTTKNELLLAFIMLLINFFIIMIFIGIRNKNLFQKEIYKVYTKDESSVQIYYSDSLTDLVDFIELKNFSTLKKLNEYNEECFKKPFKINNKKTKKRESSKLMINKKIIQKIEIDTRLN